MGSYHADSRASQNSTITPGQISASASLRGSSWVSLAGPYGPAGSEAESIFEVSFNVLTPIQYVMAVSRTLSFVDLPYPEFDFFLTSANHGNILDNHNLTGANLFSGILIPDTYTLRFDAKIDTVADPFGDFKSADYSMNLSIADVPDTGSCGLFFIITLAGLAVAQRKLGYTTRT